MTWLEELKALFFQPNLRVINMELQNKIDRLEREIDKLNSKLLISEQKVQDTDKLILNTLIQQSNIYHKEIQDLIKKNASLLGKLGWMTRNRNDWKAKAYEWSNQDNAI